MSQRRCYGCMGLTEGQFCHRCGYPAEGNNEPHQLRVGTLLHGQYLVGRALGQGGFGITYLGWDDYLDIPVAIKEYYPNSIVSRDSAQSPHVHCYSENVRPQFDASKERFLREAKALAKFMDEPAIVRIHSFFQENETAYIIMEYVQGTDLAKYMQRRNGCLSPEETFRILMPVMNALSTVHQAGLVHRDISPDNIILHPRGGAKLLDFGAVRSVESADTEQALLRSTEAILKHGFAPIEQYQSRGSLGPWTDVYALCATIYYCLTGHIPPDAPARMVEEQDVDWQSIPGLTPRQRFALNKGMAVRARDRYASVRELMADLFDFLKGSQEPTAAPYAANMQTPANLDSSRIQPSEFRQVPPGAVQPSGNAEPPPGPASSGIPAFVRPQSEPAGQKKETVKNPPSPVSVVEQPPKKKGKKQGKNDNGVKIGWIVTAILGLAILVLSMGAVSAYTSPGWHEQDGRYVYYGEDGKILKNTWLTVGDYVYYLDPEGYMVTGRCEVDGKSYVFGEDGILTATAGWYREGKNRYYIDDFGQRITGWRGIDGKRYYFHEDGVMATEWLEIGLRRYYLGYDGIMRMGWLKLGKDRYYLCNEGYMRTGWLKLGKSIYYMGEDGVMAYGWQEIEGETYFFLYQDEIINGVLYPEGSACIGTWTLDGQKYRFSDTGALQ